jgi:hypothetical protein
MINSQTLNERPFNLDDGDRYLIVVIPEGGQYSVFTRKFQNKPVISTEFKQAKTYKELKLVQRAVDEIIQMDVNYQNATIKIFQVKDIFEPRYFVQYKHQTFMNIPELKFYVDWYVQGENQPDTYLDYGEALVALDKYKKDLVEFYYGQIMFTRGFTLKKI